MPGGEASGGPPARAPAAGEPAGGGATLPEGIPEAPPPGPLLAPYLDWLDAARAVVERRVADDRTELDRLASHWAHVLVNIARLRPEEIDAVFAGQVAARERIAADLALEALLLRQRAHLSAWAEALGGPLTDPGLVRHLLDDAAEERVHVSRAAINEAVAALTEGALDVDVIQRNLERHPAEPAAVQLTELRGRLVATAERLRAARDPGPVVQGNGEPLAQTLQRVADRASSQVSCTILHRGPEVGDRAVAGAVIAVMQECVDHLATVPGADCEVTLEHAPERSTALRLGTSSAALLPDGDPAWLVRSRARAALGGGRLVCGGAGEGSFLEARFP